jgi:hypothetical protein
VAAICRISAGAAAPALTFSNINCHRRPGTTNDLIGWRPVEHDGWRLELVFLSIEAGRDRRDNIEDEAVLVAILDDERTQHESALCAAKPMLLRQGPPPTPLLPAA